MRKLFAFGAALALASSAFAAPNVTQATQKGSLLVWPDIRVDKVGNWNTLIRIQNDQELDIDIKCYWMDGNKNRVDFQFELSKFQAGWFDAKTGNGNPGINPFPLGPANGFQGTNYPYGNPYLPNLTPAGVKVDPDPAATSSGSWNLESINVDPAYYRGLLACWAVDVGGQNQVKFNHLSGTATIYSSSPVRGAYEYNAYAFFVPTGIDKQPIGVAGTLNLNGVEYDSCPLYQIGQFSPANPLQPGVPVLPAGALRVTANHLAIASCNLELQQDWTPRWTKLQFDVWNEDETKFTGAFECADSWHETDFTAPTKGGTFTVWDGKYSTNQAHQPYNNGLDSGAQSFAALTLQTYAARYRVQGVSSSQCPGSEDTGIVAVQHSVVQPAVAVLVGTTLAAAGKATGQVTWDAAGPVPEGGVR